MIKKIFFVLVMFMFVGCETLVTKYEVNSNNDERFQVVYKQSSAGSYNTRIILDKETGNKYLVVKGYYGVGVTKLEE